MTGQGLEGAPLERAHLQSDRHPNRVVLRFGDEDAGVSLIDSSSADSASIVEADRLLARLADHGRPR
jgi:hypothetical protein